VASAVFPLATALVTVIFSLVVSAHPRLALLIGAALAAILVAVLLDSKMQLMVGTSLLGLTITWSKTGSLPLNVLLCIAIIAAVCVHEGYSPPSFNAATVFGTISFSLAILLATANSPYPSQISTACTFLLAEAGLFLAGVLAHNLDPRVLAKLLAAPGVLASLISGAGYMGMNIPSPLIPARLMQRSDVNADRVRGTLGDYELLAELLALTLVILVWILHQETIGQRRVAIAVAIVPAILVLLLTQTRSAIILALIGMTLVSIGPGSRYRARSAFLIALGGIGLAGSASALLPVLSSISPGLLARFNGNSPGATVQGNTLASRINRSWIWDKVHSDVGGMPSWVGRGPRFPTEITGGSYFHSLYLSTWYCLGIIGLMSLALILLQTLTRTLQVIMTTANQGAWLFFVLSLVIILDELKIEAIRNGAYLCFIFVVLGAGLGIGCDRGDSHQPIMRDRGLSA
jgi:hypothetical protein